VGCILVFQAEMVQWLCRENREAIDKIVELLQERETIDGDEFREILSKYTKIPEENLKAAKAREPVLT
jgi:cell division protease FtsH